MRLLLFGGTIFLGKHVAQVALERGHQLSLFHRGVHGADLFPAAQHILADRDGGLGALHGRTFDAVIDFSGYLPRVVGASAAQLQGAAGHYTFVSSVSAYRDHARAGIDEDYPLAALPPEPTEDVAEWYGALKAACEREVLHRFPNHTLIVRPGLIVGPDDPSDRFTYWVDRLAEDGEVMAPGTPGHPVQVIDVRDLATWMVALVEREATGAYNAAGPAKPLTMGTVIETCKKVGGASGEVTWVSGDFLAEQGIAPWTEMPLYIPESDPDSVGLDAVSIQKAMQGGLTFRPLRETVRDTLRWSRARPKETRRRAGISRERETQALRAWHARKK